MTNTIEQSKESEYISANMVIKAVQELHLRVLSCKRVDLLPIIHDMLGLVDSFIIRACNLMDNSDSGDIQYSEYLSEVEHRMEYVSGELDKECEKRKIRK